MFFAFCFWLDLQQLFHSDTAVTWPFIVCFFMIITIIKPLCCCPLAWELLDYKAFGSDSETSCLTTERRFSRSSKRLPTPPPSHLLSGVVCSAFDPGAVGVTQAWESVVSWGRLVMSTAIPVAFKGKVQPFFIVRR